MRVSFTGTRRGMSAWQKQQLEAWLKKHEGQVTVFVHGCCIGADLEAHKIVRAIFGKRILIACFPSNAETRGEIPSDADYVAPRKPPLERNEDIVNWGCDQLLAAPLQMQEIRRSGTWAAIRYAGRKKVKVEIMWRD